MAVDLATGFGSGGDAQGDTVISIETLVGSAYNDTLAGAAGANTLAGGAGNDVLRGGAGADALQGGTGIDAASYFTGTAGVLVNLAAGTGSGGDAQGDILSSIENLSGSQGNDGLVGTSGANVLWGWKGNDVLTGAGGKDMLTGGAGGDRFVYGSAGQSVVGADADRITDFSHAQGDRIDLSAIDASTGAAGDQGFSFIGTGLYTGVAGQLRYAAVGGITTIAGDVNGDGTSDFHIQLAGAIALVAGDFVLQRGACRNPLERHHRNQGLGNTRTMEDAMDRGMAADHDRQREKTARIAVLAALPTLAVTAYAALASNSLTLLADLVLTLLDAAGVLAVWLVARRMGGGDGVARLERLAGAVVGSLMLVSFCVVASLAALRIGQGVPWLPAAAWRPAWSST